MDVMRAIRELREELAQVDAMIAVLEQKLKLCGGANPLPGRRGRKKMSRAERIAVSERMRKYWAQRKNALAAAPPGKEPIRPDS